MTDRGKQLHATADGQIAGLIALISTVDEAALRLPCPGREKLGDGTVGASMRHTADNYQRIAGFVQTSDRMSGAHQPSQDGGHRIPRFLRDGQRTLEQVLASLLKHQRHKLDALKAANPRTGGPLTSRPPQWCFSRAIGR